MIHNGTLTRDGSARRNGETELSARQLMSLPLVAGSPTVTDAARHAGVGRSTLNRWLENPEYRRQVDELQERAAEEGLKALKGLTAKAVSVLGDLLEEADPGIRFRAAALIIAQAKQQQEQEELLKRIELIESAMPIWAAAHAAQRGRFMVRS